MILKVAN